MSSYINIPEILKNCSCKYCIIRIPEFFPEYELHSDVDILCDDKEEMAEYLTNKLSIYDDIYLNIFKSPLGKKHVDCLRDGKLEIKFDLMDNFESYKEIEVSEDFKDHILVDVVNHDEVKVPSSDCEFALRYMEYVEYKDSRPEKIKHLKFIEENSKSDGWKILIKRFTNLEVK